MMLLCFKSSKQSVDIDVSKRQPDRLLRDGWNSGPAADDCLPDGHFTDVGHRPILQFALCHHPNGERKHYTTLYYTTLDFTALHSTVIVLLVGALFMDNNIKLNISCVSFRWFRSIWSVVSSDRRD